MVIVGKTECSFLGISEAFYSTFFKRYDCNWFLARDWMIVVLWIIFTYIAVYILLFDSAPRKRVILYWAVAMVLSTLFIEFTFFLGAAVGILLGFIFFVYHFCFNDYTDNIPNVPDNQKPPAENDSNNHVGVKIDLSYLPVSGVKISDT